MHSDQDVVAAVEGEGASEGYAVLYFARAAGGVEDEVDVVICSASGGVFSGLQGAHVHIPAGVGKGIGCLLSGFTIFIDVIFHFQKEEARAAAIQLSKFFAETQCFFSGGFSGFLIEAHDIPSFYLAFRKFK